MATLVLPGAGRCSVTRRRVPPPRSRNTGPSASAPTAATASRRSRTSSRRWPGPSRHARDRQGERRRSAREPDGRTVYGDHRWRLPMRARRRRGATMVGGCCGTTAATSAPSRTPCPAGAASVAADPAADAARGLGQHPLDLLGRRAVLQPKTDRDLAGAGRARLHGERAFVTGARHAPLDPPGAGVWKEPGRLPRWPRRRARRPRRWRSTPRGRRSAGSRAGGRDPRDRQRRHRPPHRR